MPFARACGNCAMYVPGPATGRGYKTGYCTHPAIGRVVRDDDSCRFFVIGAGGSEGFDENAALRAFERMKEGKTPGPSYRGGPKILNLDHIRERNAIDTEWGKDKWRKRKD